MRVTLIVFIANLCVSFVIYLRAGLRVFVLGIVGHIFGPSSASLEPIVSPHFADTTVESHHSSRRSPLFVGSAVRHFSGVSAPVSDLDELCANHRLFARVCLSVLFRSHSWPLDVVVESWKNVCTGRCCFRFGLRAQLVFRIAAIKCAI